MKRTVKTLLSLLAVMAFTNAAAQDKPQIGNSDFESWNNYSDNNTAPDNWNSFQTAEGNFAALVKAKQVDRSEDVRPGSAGKYSVAIYSRSVAGVVAQGNLTLGCINAGSMTASNKNNHNFSKIEDPAKSEAFTGMPDSLVAWVKYVPAGNLPAYPYARIAATIHDGHKYITYGSASDDTPTNKGYVVAAAEANFESKGGVWQRISVPFIYTDNNDPQFIIINISTNAEPGKGTAGDYVYVDDIELIYNPEVVTYAVSVTSESIRMGSVRVEGLKNGKANEGSTITITATAKKGYRFVQWSDGVTEPTRDIVVTGDITLTAQFEADGSDTPVDPEPGPDEPVIEPGDNPYVPCVAPANELDEPLPYEPLPAPDAEPTVIGAVSQPVDATEFIVNPSFEDGTTGWTVARNGNAITVGGQDGMKNAEFFLNNYSNGFLGIGKTNSSFSISQTISGLDNGIYKVTVQAFNRRGDIANITGDEDVDVVLSANGKSVAIKNIADEATDEPYYMLEDGAWPSDNTLSNGKYVPDGQDGVSAHFAEGRYLNEVVAEVTDGTLAISLSKPDYNMSKEWTCFDNFTLTYLGNDVDKFQATLPVDNYYNFGDMVSVSYSLSEYHHSADKAVTLRIVDEYGDVVAEQTVASEDVDGTIDLTIPTDLESGMYTVQCIYDGSDLIASKTVRLEAPYAAAELTATESGILESYTLVREEETAEVNVNFSYTDATPELGWKYAYLYLVSEGGNQILLGYASTQAETVKGNLPNNIASGNYSLLLQIGKDGLSAELGSIFLNIVEREFTITYNVEGVSTIYTCRKGESVPVPTMPEREGYTFAWDRTIPSVASSDLTINGAYTANEYFVAFVDEDGTEYYAEFQEYGSDIVAPADPVKEGYNFVGWTPEVASTVPAADVTYTAVWEEIIVDGINAVTGTLDGAVEYYTIGGVRLNAMQKGINIVKMANGEVRKVLVK